MGRGQKFLFNDNYDVCVFLFGINLWAERRGQYLPCAFGFGYILILMVTDLIKKFKKHNTMATSATASTAANGPLATVLA
jgi:hypothetical protein